MDSTVKYRLWYVWMVSLVAALGGLLFGYDWVVIGGAKLFYEKFFDLGSEWLQGWAMSCALVGCLFGALGSGALSDRFGRKRLLIVAALLFAVSSIGTGMASHFYVFIAWRICGGVAIGLASSLSPMYIAEIAPAPMRGRLVAINQFTIVIGILLAQCANWLIAEPVPLHSTAEQILASWNGQTGWRWMFGVTAIPSLLFLAGMFFVPESPRWLAKSGSYDRARAILGKVGGGGYAADALAEIRATLAQGTPRVDFKSFHGRKSETGIGRVLDSLARGRKVAVFTDPEHKPQWIAGELAKSPYSGCKLTVGEDLGAPSERVRSFSPSDAAGEEFSPLNVVLVQPAEHVIEPDKRVDPGRIFGFVEEAFEREAGMITKMEVRAVALALLQLGPGQTLWDIGAGTGSVSIESARIARLNRVFAVEKNRSRYSNLLQNL